MTLRKRVLTERFSVCTNKTSKFRTIATFKSFVKQNNDSDELMGISMTFQCTKLHSSKYSGSSVVSIKQNANINFQSPSTFVFLVSHKNVLLKVAHNFKIYQHTICHGPTLSGASFACIQKFECPPFWNYLSYGIDK
jgi:hypothetical protein